MSIRHKSQEASGRPKANRDKTSPLPSGAKASSSAKTIADLGASLWPFVFIVCVLCLTLNHYELKEVKALGDEAVACQ